MVQHVLRATRRQFHRRKSIYALITSIFKRRVPQKGIFIVRSPAFSRMLERQMRIPCQNRSQFGRIAPKSKYVEPYDLFFRKIGFEPFFKFLPLGFSNFKCHLIKTHRIFTTTSLRNKSQGSAFV